jgi:hypothetical protein
MRPALRLRRFLCVSWGGGVKQGQVLRHTPWPGARGRVTRQRRRRLRRQVRVLEHPFSVSHLALHVDVGLEHEAEGAH